MVNQEITRCILLQIKYSNKVSIFSIISNKTMHTAVNQTNVKKSPAKGMVTNIYPKYVIVKSMLIDTKVHLDCASLLKFVYMHVLEFTSENN